MKNTGETNVGGTDLLFNNDRYMFHYIESTLQGHIRYKPIIIPNPRDILTLLLKRIPRLAYASLKTPSKNPMEKMEWRKEYIVAA